MNEIINKRKRNQGKTFSDEERREYRAKRNEAMKKIAQMIGKLNAVQREELLDKIGAVATIEGHKCSMYNTLFMYYQRPEVGQLSVVGGFQQWKKARRSIKKGEKGIMMLYPMTYQRKGANEEPILNPLTGQPEIFTRFNCGTVFDISQTNPMDAEPCEPSTELGNGETIDVESEVL